jgi:hypothetical protein
MLAQESNWVSVYSGYHVSQEIGTVIRIPPVRVATLLNNRFIRCFCRSEEAKPTWWLGGTLVLVISPLASDIDFEAMRVTIPLNRFTLIEVPDVIDSYWLKFESADWFTEINLSIDKYVGNTASDSSSQPSQSFFLLGV